MTNIDSGWKLIDEARRIFQRDLKLALQEKDFNLAVRRAQEVVELSTKGALSILGVDYPKVHDVGPILFKYATSKQCPIDKEKLERISNTSLWLASVRNMSFYGEGEYSAKDARKAFEEAEFVLNSITQHFKKS